MRQVASAPHLAAIQMSKAKMGPGNKPRYRRPASGWGPHRVVVGGGGSAALSGGEILHVNDIGNPQRLNNPPEKTSFGRAQTLRVGPQHTTT